MTPTWELVIRRLIKSFRAFPCLGETTHLDLKNAAPYVVQKHRASARLVIGRPELHLHDLRHTGNTWAAATGASTRELMVRMGHATPDAALRYQHATQERDRAIAAALAELARPAPVVEISRAKKAGRSGTNVARRAARTSGPDGSRSA